MLVANILSIIAILILFVCGAACLGCGILAARKGYNIFIWAAAGGVLVSFVILAFLPFANKKSGAEKKRLERMGNGIGGALAAVSLLSLAAFMWEIAPRGSFRPSSSSLGAVYAEEGNAFAKMGDHKRAIAAYDRAIAEDSLCAEHFYNRGESWQRLGERSKAIADYTAAINLDPDLAVAYANRGVAHAAKDDRDAALADYAEAIRINDKLMQAYFNRGQLYKSMDERAKAVADFNRVIALDPTVAPAYFNRGVVWAAMGKREEARGSIAKALELEQDPALKNRYQEELALFGRTSNGQSNVEPVDTDAAKR